MCRTGEGGGDGLYQGHIRMLRWRLSADLMQAPNTSRQMAGRCHLRSASCSTTRGPSLVGVS